MNLFLIELIVADWQAAVAWYRDRLGLAVALIDEPNQYALLSTDPGWIALKAGTPSPGTTKVTFHVSDLDAELMRLADRDVIASASPRASPEGYRSVRLTDPDGHRLELFEWIRPNPVSSAAV